MEIPVIRINGTISRGVKSAEINDAGELILMLTNGEALSLGVVVGRDGTSVTHKWDGTVLTVTSASGTSSADLKGKDGSNGISAEHEWDGTVLKLSSASGTTYTDLKGEKGEPGKDGKSLSHSWDGTVLSVTSESGMSSADLKGEKGDPGENGVSVYHEWNGTVLTITSAAGKTAANLQGPKGDKGDTGTGISNVTANEDGTVTITLTDGTSYTTEGSLKGPKGDTGDVGPKGKDGILAVQIGGSEPNDGPIFWFDTGEEDEDTGEEVEITLLFGTDGELIAVIDGVEYPVTNADTPVESDDGASYIINIT